MHFIVLRHNKLSDNKNKANNVLIKALDNLYNKLERHNLDTIASILVEIIKLNFEILKQVIYC